MTDHEKREVKAVAPNDGTFVVARGMVLNRIYKGGDRNDPFHGHVYEVVVTKIYPGQQICDIQWEDGDKWSTKKVHLDKLDCMWERERKPKAFVATFDEETRTWFGQKDASGAWKRNKTRGE